MAYKTHIVSGHASYTEPRIGFRTVTGDFSPSEADKNKLESVSYYKAVDLISEGPIEGFCDATGGSVFGSGIFKGIYYDDVPIKTTLSDDNIDYFNYRNVSVAFKHGYSGQSGFYTGQGNAGKVSVDNFYWLEDFSYTSKTIPKRVALPTAKTIQGDKTSLFSASHAVLDYDVDWVNLTVGVDALQFITNDGDITGAKGVLHIWGDFTGIMHRSFDGAKYIEQDFDPNSLKDNDKVYLEFNGLSTSRYKEDILLKLRDTDDLNAVEDGKRKRNIYVRNVTEEATSFRTKFSVGLDSVTEISKYNLSYPNSAYIGTVFSAENISTIPTRTFDLKLKKVRVPHNYTESQDASKPRHVGVFNGTFKEELEWTDNPAWILYDLVTNDRYGLGEYIDDVNVDIWQLYKIAKYCDEAVNTSKKHRLNPALFEQERRYSCNILLNTRKEAYRAISEIASVFQGMAYYNANKVFVSQDSLKHSIVDFTNDSVLNGNFEYYGTAKTTRFTTIKVAYKDKDDFYLPKYEYIEDSEGILKHGIIERELVALGCTSKDQALRAGRWFMLTSNREKEVVKFATNRQAEYLKPGYLISISDQLRNGFKSGGRIKAIVNNQSSVEKNYVLLDQQLDTGNYNFSKIAFIIPGEDESDGGFASDTTISKTFIHRNSKYRGFPVYNERNPLIALDSDSVADGGPSTNLTLHNYIENTPSGAKILTHTDEDMLLLSGHREDYIDPTDTDDATSSLGYKTFNDYLLTSDAIDGSSMLNKNSRKSSTQKLTTGSIYVLEASGAKDPYKDVTKKEFRIVSISESQEGNYAVTAIEYDRGKFEDVQNLSTLYQESTIPANIETTTSSLSTAEAADPDPEETQVATQFRSLGAPRLNNSKLIVRPDGLFNQQGVVHTSKVDYFFYDTEVNSEYFHENQSHMGKYNLRIFEISDDYYAKLAATQWGGSGPYILQPGEYIHSGHQECGDFKVLYTETDEAQFGGERNLELTVPNYSREANSNHAIHEFRSRDLSTFPTDFDASGCFPLEGEVGRSRIVNEIKTDVISGTFHLPNPDSYYELRWTEENDWGESPQKVLFFRGKVDDSPPSAPASFNASINGIFPNQINFAWPINTTDEDFFGVRIYTGHIGGDPAHEFTLLDNFNSAAKFRSDDTHLLEVPGLTVSHANFSTDSRDGTFTVTKDDGTSETISFGPDAAFHIRAFDTSFNFSDSTNSNVLSLVEYISAPTLFVSGEMLEEGVGTAQFTQQSKLHIFYSGDPKAYHEIDPDGFGHYSIQVSKPNNFQNFDTYNIQANDIVTASLAERPKALGSGHLVVDSIANSNYRVEIRGISKDTSKTAIASQEILTDQDSLAPNAIDNLYVDEFFGKLRFRWDIPTESDCQQVVVFTGSGKDNFKVDESSLPLPVNLTDPSIETFEMVDNLRFAFGRPRSKEDFFEIEINKLKNNEIFEKTVEYPFHIVPIDTSNNTGMYTGATFDHVKYDEPYIELISRLEGNEPAIHVFYSGTAQNTDRFKEYVVEYNVQGDTNIFFHTDPQKAECVRCLADEVFGSGSGHFQVPNVVGGRTYDISAWIVDKDGNRSPRAVDDSTSLPPVPVVAIKDETAPGALEWLTVEQQFSNLVFRWSPPVEADVEKVVIFTGSGKQNFGVDESSPLPIKLSSDQGHDPEFLSLAADHPEGAVDFSIDRFQNEYNKTIDFFPFHIVPVDYSNNTGMYTGTNAQLSAYLPPYVHTSGELTDDERSVIHVWYSGSAQSSQSFKYYLTQYQDKAELVANTYQDTERAAIAIIDPDDKSTWGLGSGHFSFEAKGGRRYDIRTKIVGDLAESDYADDTILSNDPSDTSDDILAKPDSRPPVKVEGLTVSKLTHDSVNIEFNWVEPAEEDVEYVAVFTGLGEHHFYPVDGGTNAKPYTKHNSESPPSGAGVGGPFVFKVNKGNYPQIRNVNNFIFDSEDLKSSLYGLPFHIAAVDSSDNTGEFSDPVSLSIIDSTSYYATPRIFGSGELNQKEDGTESSFVHVFYSGQGQHSDYFKHYHIEHVKQGSLQVKHVYDTNLAVEDTAIIGGGSGHFSFEAEGGSQYQVSVQTEDTLGHKSNKATLDDGIFTALRDSDPPDRPVWKKCRKISNANIFLEWENPTVKDFKETIVYTGAGHQGHPYSSGEWIRTRNNSEVFPTDRVREALDTDTSDGDRVWSELHFWLKSVDTSNNISPEAFSVDSLPHLRNSILPGAISFSKESQIAHAQPWAGTILDEDDLYAVPDIETDMLGDGTARPIVKFMVMEDIPGLAGPLDTFDAATNSNFKNLYAYRNVQGYNVQISTSFTFYPIIESKFIDATINGEPTNSPFSDTFISGSGHFEGLKANTDYYFRARRWMKDGSFDNEYTSTVFPFTERGWREYGSSVRTLKDQTIPNNPNSFYITPGPKQVFLEWDFPGGADADLASILVYKTGIPTGRLNEVSAQHGATSSDPGYTWKTQDISGYFKDNPEEYSYKLNPGTAFIDNDIVTGMFSGYGFDVGAGIYDEPRHPVYYHYFLKTEDSSNNRGVGFVSGLSSSPHISSPNEKYDSIPHNVGYVTGGGVDDSYIESVRAGKILTDKITSNTFILANPSGRIVSDNVYAKGLAAPRYMYATGSGVYMDHKMFRIGDPSVGGEGLFFTGERNFLGEYEQPVFSRGDDGYWSHDIEPNTLEIKGHLTAGTVEIGDTIATTLKVHTDGTLTIGDQSTDITGWFTGDPDGVNGSTFSGDSDPVRLQILKNNTSEVADLFSNPAPYIGTFLEINWFRGGDPYLPADDSTNKEGVHWGREVRGIQSIVTADPLAADEYGLALLNSPAVSLSKAGLDAASDYYGLHGVVTTGSTSILPSYIADGATDSSAHNRRDYWKLIQVKFKVTNDGRLFARDANIAGTVSANTFKANETLILGQKGSEKSSIIQSLGYEETKNCSIPSGWRIRGDGKAYFSDINIYSGAISGTSLRLGKCGGEKFFNVDTDGNIFTGPSTSYFDYEANKFVVTNDGELHATDAYLSGTTSISGLLKVKDGLIIGKNIAPPYIKITDNYIGSFPSDETDYGFLLRSNGTADFSNIRVSGGMITGATLAIGDDASETRFYVNSLGELMVGGSMVQNENKFYVKSDGSLFANNATISGDLSVTGSIDVHDGLRLAGGKNWTEGDDAILLDNTSIRTESFTYGNPNGFKIDKNGSAWFNDINVTGGLISGSTIVAGGEKDSQGNRNYFAVNKRGEIFTGPLDAGDPNFYPNFPHGDPNFHVDYTGRLKAADAIISGNLTVTGAIDVKDGLRLVGTKTEGLVLDGDLGFRSINQHENGEYNFHIRPNGRATFYDINITGGAISGTNLIIGKGPSYFRVDSRGNLSIGTPVGGVWNSYDDTLFYVDVDGNLHANDVHVSGNIWAKEGMIGGLYIGPTYLSSADTSWINEDNGDFVDNPQWHRNTLAHVEGETGLYLDRDGSFSISNRHGNVIEYNSKNDNQFVTITGLKSAAAITNTETAGKGEGYYLQHGDRADSYISNLTTDSSSASGIARKIDTQMCGEIPFPIAGRTYHVISGSRVAYEILDITSGVENAAGVIFAGGTIDGSTFGVGGGWEIDSVAYGGPPYDLASTDAISIGQDLTVTMPSQTASATKFTFNIGLKRT